REQVVITDATGKFNLENLVPGAYNFVISHQVYLHPRTTEFGPLPPSTLRLVAGVRMAFVIKLIEPATVAGRTVDEDEDPVANAEVQVIRRVYLGGKRRLETVAWGTSDDSGDFKMTGLPPGRYLFKADKQPVWVPLPPV